MAETSEPNEVRLDPRSLRVLAHPLRSRLLSELRREGPATATALAGRLATNTGATSYHLRKLAEVGLVEETDDGVGRERWWRAAHEFTTFSVRDFHGDPDAEAALSWLHGEHFRQFTEKAQRWFEVQSQWPLDWQESAGASDSMLELTADEMTAMQQEIWDLVERYRTRRAPAGSGDDERHRIFFYMHCFPDTEVEQ